MPIRRSPGAKRPFVAAAGLPALLLVFAGLPASVRADDCNNNGIEDSVDIYEACTSLDLDDSGVPDECEIPKGLIADCNNNGIADWADIFGAFDMCGNFVGGTSLDCDNNGVPDECQLAAEDCNASGTPDLCEIRDGVERDDNANGIPDSCELASGAADCNSNGVPDDADLRPRLAFNSNTVEFADLGKAPAFPIDLALGDLNGDKLVDIVTAHRAFPSGESLGVFLNLDEGTFAPGVIYNTGGAAEAVTLGDFDNDGDPDAAVAQQRIGVGFAVTIMINDGEGVFTIGQNFAAGQVPIDIDAGDIDGDTDIDLVATDINGGQLAVLRNNGAGAFGPPTFIPVGTRPLAAQLADFDDDGDLDIAAITQTTGTVIVLANNGAGVFSTLWSAVLGPGAGGTDLAVGDLDADGLPDLALAVQNSRGVTTFINKGGSFAGPFSYAPHAGNPVAITTGDFDGDGITDLVTTLSPPFETGPLSINRGVGDGNILAPASFFAGSSPLSVAAADFDNDGRLDVVSGIYQERLIRVFLNASLAPFSLDVDRNGVPDECGPVCVADWNDDGVTNSTDVSDFINAWFADQVKGTILTDWDHNGVVNSTDVSNYINSWFEDIAAGCG